MTVARYAQLSNQSTISGLGRVHFVGIGGAGMSVIAQMFHSLGVEVTGSDALESAVVSALREQGILVGVPQAAENVIGAGTLVVSSAIRDSNPELVRAQDLGIQIIHRSQALALLMRDRRAIAVAGAHGKTTTSAMIAVAAQACGLDPSFAIGGSVRTKHGNIPGGFVGQGEVLVAEADESDGSFLNYEPYVAVVTNVEPDHLDHYGSKEAFERAFVTFADQIVSGGVLVACGDDPGAASLAEVIRRGEQHVITYGQSESSQVRIVDFRQVPGEAECDFTLTWQSLEFAGFTLPEGTIHVDLNVPGIHNALNAAGAFMALLALGAAPTQVAEGLGHFLGTGRRFEERGSVRSIRVVDDYAHHPTEVAALLRAARVAAGSGRVGVLFQPHLFSRTRIFQEEFAQACDLADFTVLTGIYAAREDPDPQVSADLIAKHMTSDVEVIEDKVSAAHRIAELAQPGDLILTVGAGDVTQLGEVILAQLAQRFVQA